jgi:hypothetical protein
MPTAVTRVMNSVTQPILVDRIVYATITIMSVLIIYDGWQDLRWVDVIGVIVGPVVAMFVAHVFSALLAKQVDIGEALTWSDRWTIITSESRFLLLCVPPLASVFVLFALGASLSGAIRVTLWLEGLSLGYWGYLAARRAGVVGWRVLTYIAAGLLLGIVVLLLQVALQPGKAFSGGVALA